MTRTRERLRASALRLFAELGFDGTTVQRIAQDAGVSHMTFFRHFPTKESVLFDDPYDDAIASQVLAQDRRLPVLERVRRGLAGAWGQLPPSASEETRLRVRIVAEHRGLMASAWSHNRRTGDLVVEALVLDGVDRFEARVATGACLGALMEALFDWGAGPDDRDLGDVVLQALAVLGPGTGEPAPDGAAG
ncbi:MULTISPECIES: TetR family transcriptional regulator [unclassified Actinotalea]|uniref:TetR family transcriptional regulator n=1 Tax=unclassified Actinotalea TaxID=2638618 RepID=UPI0015F47454|nr:MULTISPECIES: TetR family transcriptional regulator [unclassified Actinotalea]